MKPARRLENLPVYMFARLGDRLKELQAQGMDVIRLDIGSPDAPPPQFVVDALDASVAIPSHHTYAGYVGTPALRQAIVDYYATRFGVVLNVKDQVLPLIGSKEGIANMALAWLDPGDLALVPDPGYPTYGMGTRLAGGEIYRMPLLASNSYLPDLRAIPDTVARRARLMWLNYPNNPTGAVASLAWLAEAVAFCRRFDILLCHDAPYADVCYDGYVAPSVLQVPGADEVAIEFNSLSKSHNLAGWRVGMAVGNRMAIQALLQVKSNVDTGIFWPIQDAAVAALSGPQDWLAGRNAEYQRRRDLLYGVFKDCWGLTVDLPRASLYLWPRVPVGETSSGFVEKVLLATGVSFTPGSSFGLHGEGYMRVSVGQESTRVEEAVRRLREFCF